MGAAAGYRPVTGEIIAALRQIAGEANVLVGDEALEPYTHDETVGLRADPEGWSRSPAPNRSPRS